MPGGAERARRSRRLAVVVGALVLVGLVLLAYPSIRDRFRGAPSTPAASPAPSTPSVSRSASSTPGDEPAGPGSPTEAASRGTGGTGGAGSTGEVGVSECGRTRPAARPDRLTVVCGHGQPSMVVTEVSWGSWGQLNALGTALVVTNSCDPTCAEGSDYSYSVSVVLDQVVTTRGGSQFTRATIIWTPDRPARFRRPLQVELPSFRG